MKHIKYASIPIIITLLIFSFIETKSQRLKSYPFVYQEYENGETKIILNTKAIIYSTHDSITVIISRPWVETIAENYLFRIKTSQEQIPHIGSYAVGMSHCEKIEVAQRQKNELQITFPSGSQKNFTLIYTRKPKQ